MREGRVGRMGWYAAVGAGGVVGASVRWATGALVGTHGLPVATLLVNTVGCLVLGAVVASRAGRVGRVGRVGRPGVAGDLALDVTGVGLCGGLTTFSSFTVEVVDRLADGRAALAVAYVGLSLVAGFGAFRAGAAAVDRRRRRPRPEAAAGAAT